MKRKKKRISGTTVLLAVLFLAGLSLLLYPTVSNYINSLHQSRVIANYTQNINNLSTEQYDAMREDAYDYNRRLLERNNEYQLTEELLEQYNNLLDITGNGIMCYIEIPRINCTLPIYHGTGDDVLQVAVGHLEWSSLPVGGESTHCVVSGHRGLPSAELLTHIDKLTLGDKFYVHVLDEVLEYRVDDIVVVEPEDVSTLRVVEGMDYMTLVTCTPYGINSHRLLIRGVRAENSNAAVSGQIYVSDEIRPVQLTYVIPVVLVAAAVIFGILLWGREKRRNVYRGKRLAKNRRQAQKGNEAP